MPVKGSLVFPAPFSLHVPSGNRVFFFLFFFFVPLSRLEVNSQGKTKSCLTNRTDHDCRLSVWEGGRVRQPPTAASTQDQIHKWKGRGGEQRGLTPPDTPTPTQTQKPCRKAPTHKHKHKHKEQTVQPSLTSCQAKVKTRRRSFQPHAAIKTKHQQQQNPLQLRTRKDASKHSLP